MCVDYRKINKLQPEVTNADGGKGCISLIPLPKIDELYAKLKGYKLFSSLDLRSGYYHIGLTETAKPKSAFVLSSLGKYQFNRVPFGLAQAPAYFQFYSTGFNTFQFYSTGFTTTLSFDLGLPFLCPFLQDPFTRSVPAIHAILLLPFPYTCATFCAIFVPF